MCLSLSIKALTFSTCCLVTLPLWQPHTTPRCITSYLPLPLMHHFIKIARFVCQPFCFISGPWQVSTKCPCKFFTHRHCSVEIHQSFMEILQRNYSKEHSINKCGYLIKLRTNDDDHGERQVGTQLPHPYYSSIAHPPCWKD